MQRVTLQDGLEFSRIVYGMWRLADDADVTASNIIAKVEACLEQGITTMDHADIYGGYTVEACSAKRSKIQICGTRSKSSPNAALWHPSATMALST